MLINRAVYFQIWSFAITGLELAYGRAPYAKYPPMKVMLLTLQEEPPTAAIYKDNSYEFSKHFHSMIAKCLRRDPKKRPTARKLLEHKFFSKALDSKYVYESVVKKLPQKEVSNEKITVRGNRGAQPEANQEGNDAAGAAAAGAQAAYSNTATKAASNPGGGVKLGSWVFDEEEIEAFKSTEGEKCLDLLTGTLQHQHTLPHHHSSLNSLPDVDEPEDDEDDYVHSTPISIPRSLQAAQPTPVPTAVARNNPPTTATQQPLVKEDPPDFFAGIIAPATNADSNDDMTSAAATGRLSPSAAFAAASTGRISPAAAAVAASTAVRDRGLSTASTPTLSSVQGNKRQFQVSEEVHNDQPAPTSHKQPPVDLLADEFDLERLSGQANRTAEPSASEQFMAASGQPTPVMRAEAPMSLTITDQDGYAAQSTTSADPNPLNLDQLSLTPGSATLAYLAAMGTAEPAAPSPAPTSSPAANPAVGGGMPSGRPPIAAGKASPGVRPIASPLDPKTMSPNSKPFNSKRASGPLSSLLPVGQMSFKVPGVAGQSTSPPNVNHGHPRTSSMAIPPSHLPPSAVSNNSNDLFSPTHQPGDHPNLALNIPSPAGGAIQTTSPQQSDESAEHRPRSLTVGRFNISSSETSQ